MGRLWLYRALRAFVVALVGYVLFLVLDHYELAWVFPVLVMIAAFGWFAETARTRYLRAKREQQWERWEVAVLDPVGRPGAIVEVRAALQKSRRFGARTAKEQAHLAVVLAELYDASGRPRDAIEVLAKIVTDPLDPAQRAVVRHAKVVAYLSAGELDDAEAALAVRDASSGDAELDARLDLLAALIAVERGRIDEAEAIVRSVEGNFGQQESMRAELIVSRAVLFDARGDGERARARMNELEEPVRRALSALGPPRVRPLAAATLTLVLWISSGLFSTASAQDEAARPTEDASTARLRAESNLEDVTLHWRAESETDYRAVCRLPCVIEAEPARYRLAFSRSADTLLPLAQPIDIESDLALFVEWNDRSSLRTAGVISLVVGTLLGAALVVGGGFGAADGRAEDTEIGIALGGAAVLALSIGIGIPLTQESDSLRARL